MDSYNLLFEIESSALVFFYLKIYHLLIVNKLLLV